MIVKVQRPILPPDGAWLVYDKTRSHYIQIAAGKIDGSTRKQMGDDLRAYFDAELLPDGLLIKKRVSDQGW